MIYLEIIDLLHSPDTQPVVAPPSRIGGTSRAPSDVLKGPTGRQYSRATATTLSGVNETRAVSMAPSISRYDQQQQGTIMEEDETAELLAEATVVSSAFRLRLRFVCMHVC